MQHAQDVSQVAWEGVGIARWLCPERVAGWRAGGVALVVGGVVFALCAVGWWGCFGRRAEVDVGAACRVLML